MYKVNIIRLMSQLRRGLRRGSRSLELSPTPGIALKKNETNRRGRWQLTENASCAQDTCVVRGGEIRSHRSSKWANQICTACSQSSSTSNHRTWRTNSRCTSRRHLMCVRILSVPTERSECHRDSKTREVYAQAAED